MCACVRVYVRAYVSDVRTFGCLCDLYSTTQVWMRLPAMNNNDNNNSRTTSSRTVWLCVQSKWNRDRTTERKSRHDRRMVVSKLRKTYRIRRISCICELESLRLYIVERFFISHVAIYLLQSKFILQILFLSFSSSLCLSLYTSLSIQNRLIQLMCFNF